MPKKRRFLKCGWKTIGKSWKYPGLGWAIPEHSYQNQICFWNVGECWEFLSVIPGKILGGERMRSHQNLEFWDRIPKFPPFFTPLFGDRIPTFTAFFPPFSWNSWEEPPLNPIFQAEAFQIPGIISWIFLGIFLGIRALIFGIRA